MDDLAHSQIQRRWGSSDILTGADRADVLRALAQLSVSPRAPDGMSLLPLRLTSRFDGTQWSGLTVQLVDDPPQADEIVNEYECENITEVFKACRGQWQGGAIFRAADYSVRFQAACEKRDLVSPSTDMVVDAVRAMVRMLKHAMPAIKEHALYICLSLRQIVQPQHRGASRDFLFTVQAVKATPLAADLITVLVCRRPNAMFDQERRNRNVDRARIPGLLWDEARTVPPLRLCLDASRHVQGLSHLNFFAVIDGSLHTPSVSDKTYPGITRRSVMRVARFLGMDVIEAPMQITDLLGAIMSGKVSEAFVTGVVCTVAPVGALKDETGTEYRISTSEGTLTRMFRKMLLDIQEGRLPDEFGWMQVV